MKKFIFNQPRKKLFSSAVKHSIQTPIIGLCRLLFAAFILLLSSVASATNFDVTDYLDDAVAVIPGSLRQALIDLAADPSLGPHTITFRNITAQTITLAGSLPSIDKQVSFVSPVPLTIAGAAASSAMLIGATGDVTVGANIAVSVAQTQNAGSLTLVSPLTLNTGSFSQLATGTLNIGLTSASCVSDAIAVTGAVTLAGNLKLNQDANCKPALNSVFTLISNNQKDGISGTFSGLAEGAEITLAPYKFKISYKGGTGNDVTLTVSAVPLIAQTITFPALVSPRNTGQTAALTATASSDLAVGYTATPTSICTLSSVGVSFIGVGTCTITASQAGNATYSAAPDVAQDVVVNGVASMTLTPATLDFASQQINSSSTKTVTVKNSGSADLNITAVAIQPAGSDYTLGANTCSASIAPNATCTVDVIFKPTAAGARTAGLGISPNAGVAQSVQLTGVGTLIPQTINFPTIASPQTLGTPAIPLGASASSGLQVSYTATLGICTEAGGSLTFVGVGTCTVTVNQAGNNIYASATAAAGTSLTQTFTVNKAAQTITFTKPADVTFGQASSVSVSATASSGLTVTFNSTTPTVCTTALNAPSPATVTIVGGGTCSITATQTGDVSHAAAAPVTQTFTVNKAVQIITFNKPADVTYAVGLTVPIAPSVNSPLVVALSSTTTGVCTLNAATSPATVTIVGGGTCSITATQTGDVSHAAAAPVTQTFTVNKAAQTITFSKPADVTFGQAASVIVSATTTSSGLTVTFNSTTPAVCTTAVNAPSPATVTLVGGGTCAITATQSGDNRYAAATDVLQSFAVNKAAQTITFTKPADVTFGQASSVSVSATASSGLTVTFNSTTPTVCTTALNAPSPATVTLVGGGTCSITASQAATGSTNYNPATPVTQPFAVGAAGQTITFAKPNDRPYAPTPFSVSATGSSGGLPLKFSTASPNTICVLGGESTVVTSAGITTTVTVTMVGAGVCSITASREASASYSAASVTQTFNITKANQLITLAQPADVDVGVAPIALNPSADSGLPVSLAVAPVAAGAPVICEVALADAALPKGAWNVTVLNGGTCAITASQSGDVTRYNAAPSLARSFEVKKLNQIITLPTLANKVFGDPDFALVATSGASGNPVTFASATPLICTTGGTNGATVSIAGAGTCSIKADQAGNTKYNAAASVSQSFTVAKKTQTIVIAPLGDQVFSTVPIPISATGGGSGNPVLFTSVSPGICTVSAGSVSLLAPGNCTINADQAGNANYEAAATAPLVFRLGAASQTITFVAPTDKVFGDPAFNVSATASSGLPVTFVSSTAGVCTVTGTAGTASVALLTAGKCTIVARQAGNDKYTVAADIARTFTVASTGQVIRFAALPAKTFGDVPFDVSASGGASGNPVSFISLTDTVCKISGNTVSIIAAGSCTIQANQAGNGNYAAAPSVSQTFAVAKAAQTIAFAALPDKTLGDAPPAISAQSSAGLPVSFESITGATCAVAGNAVTITAGGKCTIRASQPGNDNYAKAADVEQTFNVNPANGTIAFAQLPAKPIIAGEPLTFNVTVKGAGNTPTGTVIFKDNDVVMGAAVPLVNGIATFTTTALSNGNHRITATYSGDGNNNSGTSDVLGVTVLVQTTVTGSGGGGGGGSSGGGGCTLNPQAGFDPSMMLMLFAALVYLTRRKLMKIKYLAYSWLLLAMASGPAAAIEPGFYLGVGAGKSSSEGDNFDFNQRLKNQGFNVDTTLDFKDLLSWKIFTGYQVNPYLALEASYLDLGRVTASASGAVADPAAFANAVIDARPRLAKGASFALVGSMPVNPKFFAFAKLGAIRWTADVGASTGIANTERSEKGNSAFFALGGEADLGSGWSVRAEVERFQIKPDPANLFALGLLRRF